jgi:hypothetical protein
VSEIDFPGCDTGLNVSGGVLGFTGNDIPELVLNEETLRSMHPVMEIIRIELSESERRRFGKSESERGCVGHNDFENFLEKFWMRCRFR